jgi:aryl-alcohol dehydrogenase-like predicted oxidoreductase
MAAELGLTVTAWGVLEHGLLSGRRPETLRWPVTPSDRALAVLAAVEDVAAEAGATTGQVAIAWLRRRVIPIVGVRTAEQLEENLGALDVTLSGEQIERIDTAGDFALGFPRSFLESDGVRELIYGQTWPLLDSSR